MRIIILFIATFLLVFQAIGQHTYTDWKLKKDSTNQVLVSQTDLSFQTNSLTNAFTNKFIFGGYIDRDLIQKTEEKNKDINTLGVEFSTGLKVYMVGDSVFKSPKWSNWGYSAWILHHSTINSSFTSDLFHAVFIGNADRVGETLTLGPSSFNSVTYQEIGMGLYHKKTGSEIGISVVKGQGHSSLNFTTADLFTAADVSELEFAANGSYRFSDSARNNLLTANGFGASLNFTLNKEFKIGAGQINLSLKGQGLGLVSWSKQPQNYTIDTTYNWAGYEIDNLFNSDINNWFNEEQLRDSLLPYSTKESYSEWLPGVISLTKLPDIDSDNTWQSIGGIRYRFNANYFPLIHVGAYCKITDSFATSGSLLYGGYGGLSIGIRANYHFGNTFSAYLSSNNMVGMASKNGYGKSLNIGLLWRL